MEVEKKPWWVSDQEKDGLGTVPAPFEDPNKAKEYGTDLGKEVQDAVPQMKMLTLSHLICEYGEKDGLVNYHFYTPIRYSIRMEAEGELEKIRHSSMSPQEKDAEQQKISDLANHALERNPWPGNFEEVAKGCFTKVFKYTEFKLNYFSEVDSFSLVMPEPKKGFVTTEMLEAPVHLTNGLLAAG